MSCASASIMADLLIGHGVEEVESVRTHFEQAIGSRGRIEGDEELIGDGVALMGAAKFPARVKCVCSCRGRPTRRRPRDAGRCADERHERPDPGDLRDHRDRRRGRRRRARGRLSARLGGGLDRAGLVLGEWEAPVSRVLLGRTWTLAVAREAALVAWRRAADHPSSAAAARGELPACRRREGRGGHDCCAPGRRCGAGNTNVDRSTRGHRRRLAAGARPAGPSPAVAR